MIETHIQLIVGLMRSKCGPHTSEYRAFGIDLAGLIVYEAVFFGTRKI